MVGLPSGLGGGVRSTAGFMSEGPEDADSTGTSATRRSGRVNDGADEAAPSPCNWSEMHANDDTPPSGENVSEEEFYQQFSHKAVRERLTRADDVLHGEVRQVISGDRPTREDYSELFQLYLELGEALELLDELTYHEQQREGGD